MAFPNITSCPTVLFWEPLSAWQASITWRASITPHIVLPPWSCVTLGLLLSFMPLHFPRAYTWDLLNISQSESACFFMVWIRAVPARQECCGTPCWGQSSTFSPTVLTFFTTDWTSAFSYGCERPLGFWKDLIKAGQIFTSLCPARVHRLLCPHSKCGQWRRGQQPLSWHFIASRWCCSTPLLSPLISSSM